MSGRKVRVIYPDMGVAAMIKSQQQAKGREDFDFGSLSDRMPYPRDEDEVIVFANSDVQGVEKVMEIARAVEGINEYVMFNPRTASGDLGVGMVARKKNEFFQQLKTVYALQPFPDKSGTVFTKFPDMWKVFIGDPQEPGRYKLLLQRDWKPDSEEIEEALKPGGGEVVRTSDGATAEQMADDLSAGVVSVFKEFGKWAKEIQSLR